MVVIMYSCSIFWRVHVGNNNAPKDQNLLNKCSLQRIQGLKMAKHQPKRQYRVYYDELNKKMGLSRERKELCSNNFWDLSNASQE
jgi:hypothetical protein